jgi:hypothetical protein
MNRSGKNTVEPTEPQTSQSEFHFNGFQQYSSYTYTPDFMMDYFPAFLSSGEIRVIDYLFRRSSLNDFDVSLTQMQNGLVTRDGKRLDHGCGLTKPSIIKALKGLELKGVVKKQSEQGFDGRNLPNIYQLNYGIEGWKTKDDFEKFVGSDNSLNQGDLEFEGFDFPSFTPVPDVIYDLFPAVLSSGAYLLLRYICRHTFGYKKREDDISISQMLDGIVSRDGERMDFGSGIKGRATVVKAIKELEAFKVVQKTRNRSASGRDLTTTYSLIFKGSDKASKESSTPSKEIELPLVKKLNPPSKEIEPSLVKKLNPPSKEIELPLVKKLNTQETAIQKTEKQETEKQQQQPLKQADLQQQPVAVVLIDFGFSEFLAKKLAHGNTLEYVQEKIHIFEFICINEPAKIKNKLGWVRTAIEQDYQKPSNYRSPADIDAERNAEQMKRMEWVRETEQIQLEKKQEQAVKQIQDEEKKEALIQAGQLKFGTTEEDISEWNKIKDFLFLDEIESLEGLKIVSDDGIIVIGVLGKKVYQKVAHDRFKQRLKADISKFLKKEVQSVDLIFLEIEGEPT